MAQSSTMPSLTPQVQEFVRAPRRMLIYGAWVEAASSKIFPIYDPSTEDIIAHVAEGEAEDIDRAVQTARQALIAAPGARSRPRSVGGCCGGSAI
jgi:phenylacetaldehyde dehydrogenase